MFSNSLLKNGSYMKKIFILCVISLFLAINSMAAVVSASQWIDVKGREFLNIFAIEDKYIRSEKIEEMFYNYIDVDYIAKFVMGRYWREMSDDEKAYYLEIFPKYAINSYQNIPIVFDATSSFKILSEKEIKQKTDYEVAVEIKIADLEDNEYSKLYFRVRKYEDAYKILDVKTEGGSILLVYRDKFAQMLKDRNYDYMWFIDDLQ